MKILSSEEIRKSDAYTIEHEPIKSIDLMERAANVCVEWLTASPLSAISLMRRSGNETIKIFCGLGNNGGDGLAIARLLSLYKYKVEVFIIRHSEKCSEDFLINEKRLEKIKNVKIDNITSAVQLEKIYSNSTFNSQSYIIDAIFGSGLNKPVEGLVAEVIDYINNSGCPVISIDIPSGLFAEDNSKNKKEKIIQATHTLTFQNTKLAFMFPMNENYVGDFSVLNIGLDKSFIASLPSKNYFVTMELAKSIYRLRKKFSHKGTFGHALIVAGSLGKIGACVLASKACLRAGAGLVTVHIPKCGYTILQTTVPEVMVEIDSSDDFISNNIIPEKYNAIGIGPGIGMEKQTRDTLKFLIQNSSIPLVLDADALNILSENKTWLSFLPKNSILTPHHGEFRRLIGNTDNDYERLQMQKDFSIKHKVYVILKGAHSCITCPSDDEEIYFNSTGNSGMATAGSGDVLTGIITGLLAQGYDSKQASILGVFLHGLAGDIAAETISRESLIARDIIYFLGKSFLKL
ncbi:MAG: NAD(P)H-hydrate dehydratase [Bacteroidota bacterium]